MTRLIGKVNGRYGQASWTPIRYVNCSHSRTALSGIYRAADVALVTPLRDGMNLVAKEYIAAQDAENPGVLVLSQFAGAAAELTRALIVNPHDSEAMAAALKRALEMPLVERRERHGPMLKHLLIHDVEHWAESFLSMLAHSRTRAGLMSDGRPFLTPSRASADSASQFCERCLCTGLLLAIEHPDKKDARRDSQNIAYSTHRAAHSRGLSSWPFSKAGAS